MNKVAVNRLSHSSYCRPLLLTGSLWPSITHCHLSDPQLVPWGLDLSLPSAHSQSRFLLHVMQLHGAHSLTYLALNTVFPTYQHCGTVFQLYNTHHHISTLLPPEIPGAIYSDRVWPHCHMQRSPCPLQSGKQGLQVF